MKKKKTVHIISHSHLDREWYLPLIEHQMYLVDLIDNIVKLSKDKRFNSFHLDGQVIPLEDYFKIKPENKEIVLNLIKNKKLMIGPWYVLQDSFLISSESNLRDLQVGMNEAERYLPKNTTSRDHMFIGYFPDTFGNVGQMPQILKRAGMDITYFGRGVKATGFNNVVLEDFTSSHSEMYWQSKDGTNILGVLFANWYCNVNGIPVGKKEAKQYWDQKLKDVEKYAATSHLLMMNGCDHQPLQMDVLDAIDTANSLYEDYEFIHSNFKDYSKAVEQEIKEKNIKLDTVRGELRSQRTDGWYTLQGTSSNRVYLKVQNKKSEYLLEEQVEPILLSIYPKDKYPKERLEYAWKTLLSNHPHDSICGTGVDSVHRGMEERFKEVCELSNHLTNRAFYYYQKNVDTRGYKQDYLFTVHNMTQYSGIKEVDVSMDLRTIKFSDMFYEKGYETLSKESMPKSVSIYLGDKLVYETNLDSASVMFDYELPEDKFRVPYWAKKVKFKALVDMPAFTRKTFGVKFSDEEVKKEDKIQISNNGISNEFVSIEMNEDGTFNIYNKKDDIRFTNLGIIEDSGDVGNEYIYKEAIRNRIYSNSTKVNYEIVRINDYKAKIVVHDILEIPKCADEKLKTDQIKLEEVTKREIKRSNEYVKLHICKELELTSYSETVKMSLKYTNNALDHRLRVLFKNDIKTSLVYPESIYEVATRDIFPSKEWKNPDNSQNLNRFVNLRDDEKGITLGTNGIAEYEVLKEDNTLALTMGRYTGEIGDWGYFPTRDSQGLREFNLEVYICTHKEDYLKSFHNVLEKRKVYLANQVPSKQSGILKADLSLGIDVSNLLVTALKRDYSGRKIIRVCNYVGDELIANLPSTNELDILEYNVVNKNNDKVKNIKGYQIRTFELEE